MARPGLAVLLSKCSPLSYLDLLLALNELDADLFVANLLLCLSCLQLRRQLGHGALCLHLAVKLGLLEGVVALGLRNLDLVGVLGCLLGFKGLGFANAWAEGRAQGLGQNEEGKQGSRGS